jgi:microtubule-associated protein, RP/EB family
MSNIGMMDGAFFVGRKEIVDWINQTLNVNLTKVEQTASGAIACQLLDVMHPGRKYLLIEPHVFTDQVPMHKVNWSAKQDFEFIQNYKILQTCFTKLSIDRVSSPLWSINQSNFLFSTACGCRSIN